MQRNSIIINPIFTKHFISNFIIMKRSKSVKINMPKIILGIETSCDDTGCAIVSQTGTILGECLHSQHKIHLRRGGINPQTAMEFHKEHIERVVKTTLIRASMRMEHVDAIAVTVKPGLPRCLETGVRYANYLSRLYDKVLIPIHHMKAHALIARMYYNIEFPFLVLLISGGHCLIAIAKNVEEYKLLGECLDNPPGEAFDKVARRMKLRNIPKYSEMSGGQAIEAAALNASNPTQFTLPLPMTKQRDCNFSFSGLKESVLDKLTRKEKEHGVLGDGIIPEINDLCAAFQMAVTKHLVHRVQRADKFCEIYGLLPSSNKTLVVSGGVACNNFIFKSLQLFGKEFNYKVYRPPQNVCTDNGIMVAWNGVERLRHGFLPVMNIHQSEIEPKAPLGTNDINDVEKCSIATKVMKLNY